MLLLELGRNLYPKRDACVPLCQRPSKSSAPDDDDERGGCEKVDGGAAIINSLIFL